MVRLRQRAAAAVVAALLAMVLAACATLAPAYNQQAYKNATDLKAETLGLLSKAGDQYTNHASAADAVTVKINAAYEYSAGLAANGITAALWDRLRKDVYGPFINTWRNQRTVSAAYREDKAIQIARAYDIIICVEANKQSDTVCMANR